uniref:RING-type domain-containing protein n=1 Tax=Acrobeloides nanus TaxID=290746 RepID=A0A914DHG9_9BILA
MDSNLSDSEVSTDSADDVLAPTSENLKTHNEPLAETNSNLLDAYREQWNLLQELSDANMARLLEEEEMLNAHESEVSQYKHNLPADKSIECVICRENFLLGNGIRCQKQKIKENLGVDFHEFCRNCVKNYIEATVDTIHLCKRDAAVHVEKTCEEIDLQEAEAERERIRVQQVQYHDEMAEIISRRCKNCSTPIIKSTGCNKLRCRCGTTMCYWCGASNINSDHFRQGPCKNKLHDEGYQERDSQAVEAIRQRMNDL